VQDDISENVDQKNPQSNESDDEILKSTSTDDEDDY